MAPGGRFVTFELSRLALLAVMKNGAKFLVLRSSRRRSWPLPLPASAMRQSPFFCSTPFVRAFAPPVPPASTLIGSDQVMA
jgi:hypothetical protein